MSQRKARPTRVLFVEDDPAARAGYMKYLVHHGLDVVTASTGHDALALAMASVPDVIVLDLGLPDLDGWEVARRLRADPETVAVPIIALTGAGLPHERVSAMRAGCDRHLTKPCAPAALLDAIMACSPSRT
jgi:DNA-binding response OmpR family regulator